MNRPPPDWTCQGNLGKAPSQLQKRALKRLLHEVDRDLWEVDAETEMLTRFRKDQERLAANAAPK